MSDTSPSPQPFLERLSDSLQHLVHVLVGAQGKPPRLFRSLLNGTWLGHPLHPVMTDVPVTAWILTVVFDIIWLISPTNNKWAAYAAFVAVIAGLVGALGAIATGFTDWSDTYGPERRVGLIHSMFNASATILFLISFILRLVAGPGDGVAAAILGFVGLACVFYAAYLGGDMVYRLGTNVNHTAWEAGPEDYQAVMPADGVEENRLYRVTASGVAVLLLRQGKDFFAISATCPHAGGPLGEGTLTGDIVECPWHGSRFCVRDGRVRTGPATVNAPRYDVRINNGQVEVKRHSES